MGKKEILMFLFITVFFSLSSMALDKVIINDELLEADSFRENIQIMFENDNINSTFKFSLPIGAYDIIVNNNTMEGNLISVQLNCTSCVINVSYYLDDVIVKQGKLYSFSRTLNLPKNPKILSYSIEIPQGYIVDLGKNNPAIVPNGALKTDGKKIIVSWNESNPELPKIYFVRYKKLKSNLSVIFLFIGLFVGISLTYYFFKYYKKELQNEVVEVIPASLLTPDEMFIIKLLNKNNKKMNQREMVRSTNWSKSKVSAILSNLDYKKIIEREKFGRNYKVTLIKKVSD